MLLNVLCEDSRIAEEIRSLRPGVHVYGAVFPHVFRSADAKKAEALLQSGEVVIRTLDELGFLKERGYRGRIIADTYLYAWNKEALSFLKEEGIARDTAPAELTCHELSERGVKDSELVVYGRLPMMVSAQCVYRNSHDDHCAREEKKEERDGIVRVKLTDRKNTDFPCLCYCGFCYHVIYNSMPLSLHGEREEIGRLAPASLRLHFTTESREEALRITDYFTELFREGGAGKKNVPDPPFRHYTKGHFRSPAE